MKIEHPKISGRAMEWIKPPSEIGDLPTNGNSSAIGDKALKIAKWYLERRGYRARDHLGKGADLDVISPDGDSFLVEVKGSEGADPFKNLIINGRPSYDLLTEGRSAILRVLTVDLSTAFVGCMLYGQDFTLDAEPRWRAKPTAG